MDMDNKIYVSEANYSRLCRIDGKMDSVIEFLQYEAEKNNSGYVAIASLKAIIGLDNFEESTDV